MKIKIISLISFLTLALFSCKEKGLRPVEIVNQMKPDTLISVNDVEFEKLLIYRNIDKDSIVNGKIKIIDSTKIRTIDFFEANGFNIQDFSNFAIFPNLKVLKLGGKPKFIDLSKCKNLTFVEIYAPNIDFRGVDLTQNNKLTGVRISTISQLLYKLDLSKNSKLANVFLSIQNESPSSDFSLILHDDAKLLGLYIDLMGYSLNNFDTIIQKVDTNAENIGIFGITNEIDDLNFARMNNLKLLYLDGLKLKKMVLPDESSVIKYVDLTRLSLDKVDLSSYSNLYRVNINFMPNIKNLDISSSTKINIFASLQCPKLDKICVNNLQKIDSFPSYPANAHGPDNQHLWFRDPWAKWVVCK